MTTYCHARTLDLPFAEADARAREALRGKDESGAMLPCIVVVEETGAGRTEAAAVDAVASMPAVAGDVRDRLRRAVDRIRAAVSSIQLSP